MTPDFTLDHLENHTRQAVNNFRRESKRLLMERFQVADCDKERWAYLGEEIERLESWADGLEQELEHAMVAVKFAQATRKMMEANQWTTQL